MGILWMNSLFDLLYQLPPDCEVRPDTINLGIPVLQCTENTVLHFGIQVGTNQLCLDIRQNTEAHGRAALLSREAFFRKGSHYILLRSHRQGH